MFVLITVVALALGFAAGPATAGPVLPCAGSDWTDRRVLNAGAEYTIDYKVVGEELVIRLRARTTGYLGFGLSEAGHMMGSDIVTAAVVDGVPRVEDRFSLWEAFPLGLTIPTPKQDKCQHWSVVCSEEAGGYTDMILKRLLNTGDTEDRVVKNETVAVIFAWGSQDSVGYHSSNRGSTTINFFTTAAPAFTKPADANVEQLLVLGNYDMKSTVTQYIIQRGIVVGSDVHIVAIEPVVREQDAPYVHHILVHDCGPLDGAFLFGSRNLTSLGTAPIDPLVNFGFMLSPLGLGPCQNMIFGWAVGGSAVAFPPGTGVLAGSTGARNIILEVHLNNADEATGVVIASGVKLHMAPVRQYNLGTIVLGNAGANLPTMTQGLSRVHYESSCPTSCTSRWKGPIRIIGSFPHMHSFGREIWTTKFDENGASTIVSSKQFWNFEFQTQIALDIEIKNGTDRLTTHCVYDTSKATAGVSFGMASAQEMCMDFVMYYPKENAGLFCGRTSTGSGTQCVSELLNEQNPGTSSDGTTAVSPTVAVGAIPGTCPVNNVGGTPGSDGMARSALSSIVLVVAFGMVSVFVL